MSPPADPPERRPERKREVPVSAEGVFREMPQFPERRSQRTRIPILGLFGEMPVLREKPSFPEWFGAHLASRLLWVICGLAGVFLAGWWFTRPTLTGVQQLLGSSAQATDVMEALRTLRDQHFDQFRSLFQLIVLSGLVPLFTLLAGYAFGRSRVEAQTSRETENSEEAS